MANHKSAIKEHRQSLKRRDRNRFQRARMRTAVKALRKSIEEGNQEDAKSLLPGVLSLVDRTAKLGAIKTNTASRTKSRLSLAVNRIAAAG